MHNFCDKFCGSDPAYCFAYGSLCTFLLAVFNCVSLSVFLFSVSCVIMICIYTVFQKTCDHVFDDKLKSRFQSHMSHCRVQSPGEISVVIVPHCKV